MCWPKLLCYLRAFSLISGGRRWNRISDTLPGQLIVLTVIARPANPNIVYASTSGGIYVSQNAGGSWVSLQSADAPKSAGGFETPYYFNGAAFDSVATVVREDEPMIIDPQTSHLLHGGAGVQILVGMR